MQKMNFTHSFMGNMWLFVQKIKKDLLPHPKSQENKSSKHYWVYISHHHKSIDETNAFSKAFQLQVQRQ